MAVDRGRPYRSRSQWSVVPAGAENVVWMGIHRLVFSGSPPQRIWKMFLTACTPSLSAEILQ